MTSNTDGIAGVVHSRLTEIVDDRGSFTEIWRASGTATLGVTFTQGNISRSRAGVLRGMHFHDHQLDLWVVVNGRALVALADLRAAIHGTGATPQTEQFELIRGSAVLIPRRVAHGFLALEALDLIYLVSREYDGTDEFGFRWDDLSAGLRWPKPNPIVSQRDASGPSLADALEAARQRHLA
jgi:dTDP-4-dehydrorhamnose 3,5-epimerase